MANKKLFDSLLGELLDEDTGLSLGELCRVSQLPADSVLRLVEEGVIDPVGKDQSTWRFSSISIRRVRRVRRLRDDLGVNLSGAALALDLLEEIEALRAKVRLLEGGQ